MGSTSPKPANHGVSGKKHRKHLKKSHKIPTVATSHLGLVVNHLGLCGNRHRHYWRGRVGYGGTAAPGGGWPPDLCFV